MTIDEATFESLAAATLQRFAQRIEDAADDLDVGQGYGPVNHLGELWRNAAPLEIPDVEAE